MKKRARVKVTDFAGLVAWPLAAARAVAETLQSSIRPRGAGQSAVRGSGAQSSSAAVLCERGQIFMRARPSSVKRSVRGAGRVQVVSGRSWRRLDGTRTRRPRMLEATNLAVAQAVVAEGEHAPGDRDLGDVAAAAFGDALERGPQRAAAGCCFLRGLDERPADVRGALPRDVAEPCLGVGGADGRSESGPGAEMTG
jgi:hypothetical protein